jgi:hypothetical protein
MLSAPGRTVESAVVVGGVDENPRLVGAGLAAAVAAEMKDRFRGS